MRTSWKRIWARAYSLLLGYYYGNAFGEPNPYYVCKNKLYLPEGNLNASYVDAEEFRRLTQKFTGHLLRVGVKKYAREYEASFKASVPWARTLVKGNLKKLSNDELIGRLREFHKFFLGFTSLQYLSFAILEGPGKEVEAMALEYPDPQEILSLISAPYKITKINQARQELLKIASAKKVSRPMLENYLKKYSWISLNDFRDPPLTKDSLKKQIRSVEHPEKELEGLVKTRLNRLAGYKALINSTKDDKKKKLIEIVHYFSYLKEMRDDYRRRVYFILRPLWAELGSRIGLEFDDVNFFTVPEMIKHLENGTKADKKLAAKRKRSYSIAILNGEIRVYDRDISKKFLKRRDHEQGSARGRVAYAGIARGVVRIINRHEQFKNFKRGDVLVTVMTHPEFLPLMKMAKAIVTDEGGITCHAAIVSRELKTPCVIGTKIATKVFKDGDLVEVDANKGIVRKI